MFDIKSDFPVFDDKTLVYLDTCSSSQKPKFVIDGISEHLSKYYANIHRGMYNLSDFSEDLYDKSKSIIAKNLNVKSSQIIYTYNSTYAFNILSMSLYFSNILKNGDKILLSIAEHHSNIVPWLILKDKIDIEIDYVNIDKNGDIDLQDFEQKYDKNVKIVSFTYVSNLTGTIFDLENIGNLLRDDTIFVVDGSQAVPNFPVDFQKINADFLIFTGHKLMANTGIGVLVANKNLLKKMNPCFGGGGNIKDVSLQSVSFLNGIQAFEAGTPNISGAISLLKAFEYIESIGGFKKIWEKEQELTKYMLDGFLKRSDKIELIGKNNTKNRLGVFSFILKGNFSAIKFGEFMAMKNICIRCGGHCAHPYLKFMGYLSSCRVSLYVYNNFDDIDKFFDAIDEFIN
ncbi:aminotransferase class V-fold PLP-dependent enzyme [Candidatus Vampirococcus lugosii]|uniref:Cysteine desulfurase n=1 Tax=Candidatus Vampirococcus lugosii TaxID=2789015 RepID=A0ABS5QMR9_9BACT|nr:aminotransferase class V-fold PLP-dependent enzyme [Candidatus Vampirococcus lugosii]MBS8122018.1 Cysteine desulfurase [Candidatus Vampirococcus lugosii]